MECELCGKPIQPSTLYIEARRYYPPMMAFTPESKQRGIHVSCIERTASD
jgi:hypothetical protein